MRTPGRITPEDQATLLGMRVWDAGESAIRQPGRTEAPLEAPTLEAEFVGTTWESRSCSRIGAVPGIG